MAIRQMRITGLPQLHLFCGYIGLGSKKTTLCLNVRLLVMRVKNSAFNYSHLSCLCMHWIFKLEYGNILRGHNKACLENYIDQILSVQQILKCIGSLGIISIRLYLFNANTEEYGKFRYFICSMQNLKCIGSLAIFTMDG